MVGSSYDDIRISRISDDEFLGGLCPSSGHKSAKGRASLWTISPMDNVGLTEYEADSWSELKSRIKEDCELRIKLSKHFH